MFLQMFGKANYFLSDSGGRGAMPCENKAEAYGPYGHAVNPEAATRRALPPWWPDDAQPASSGTSSTASAAGRQQPRSLLPQPGSQPKQQQIPLSNQNQSQRNQNQHQQKLQQQDKLLQQQQKLQQEKLQQQRLQQQKQQQEKLLQQQRFQQQKQQQEKLEQQRKQEQMEQRLRQQQEQQELLKKQRLEQEKRQLQLQRQQIEWQQRELRQQQEERMQQQQMSQRELAYQHLQYDSRHQFECTLCGLNFSSSAELQIHKSESSEHRSNQKMLICREECLRIYGMVTDHRLMQFLLHFCHACCMAFENETQLARHTASSVHLAATGLPPQAGYATTASVAGIAASAVSASSTYHSLPETGRYSSFTDKDDRSHLASEATGGSVSQNSLFGTKPSSERKRSDSSSRKQKRSRPRSSLPYPAPNLASSSAERGKQSNRPKPNAKHAPPSKKQANNFSPSKARPDSKLKTSGNSLLGVAQAAGKKRPAGTPLSAKPPPSKRSLDNLRPQSAAKFHCSICNKHFNSEKSSNEHFSGRKHAAAVANAAAKPAASNSAVKDIVYCDSCRISVRRDQLVAHRASERHTQELAKIGAAMMRMVSN